MLTYADAMKLPLKTNLRQYLQRNLRQNLYFCTSKARKSSTFAVNLPLKPHAEIY
jgi:hypothetical protein